MLIFTGMQRFEGKFTCCADSVYLATGSFLFGSGRFCSVMIAALSPCSGCHSRQITHPHQIVGGQCEGKHPADASHTAVASLTQAADGLEPAEDFFDPFTFLLT